MTTKVELVALVEHYARKVAVHASIEATRVAVDRKDRGPRPTELRLKAEAQEAKDAVEDAINGLAIE